jgi:hypothetical protein
MANQENREELQKRLSTVWDKHQHTAEHSDEGPYISLKNINLAEHGLDMKDTRAPGNLSLSPTSTTQHDNYFLRGFEGGNLKLFRNRNVNRNI